MKKKIIVTIVIAVVLAVGVFSLAYGNKKTETSDMPVYEAQRGPLKISIVQSGTIKSRDQIVIKSELEGRNTIITLIPEGTVVKKGDLLVELDASNLVDKRVDQEITVQNAEASLINAKEDLEITKNQAKSDISKAQLDLDFAKQDLEKYLEGDYPNQLTEKKKEITLAKEELALAEERLANSQVLYAEKFISKSELQSDEIAEQKRRLNLELAENDLMLLEEYTHNRNIAQYESDVDQAEMALDRIKRKSNANIIQAEANLRAKTAEFERQKEKLAKYIDQLDKTKIYAPSDGLVIYASSTKGSGWRGRTEPLTEGSEVSEREELIHLPKDAVSNAELALHEASLQKVKSGMRTIVSVDAIPGRTYTGKVFSIAPLPDPQSMWLNPDLKVYTTIVHIDQADPELRSGMSCKVEIIGETYDDVVYVPIQAVVRHEGRTVVYLEGSDEPHPVEVGLDNNVMVHIKSGLEGGERVQLTPPLQSETYTGQSEVIPAQIEETKPDELTAAETPAAGTDIPAAAGKSKKRPANLENLTPEQREELKKKIENMTPEQREQLKNRMQQQLE
ncbi:putative efflux pump membrane fusion protein [Limihaloglobus sulfuriphilus]|uniref:Putative efflux pump membrane fusion protein n=1 Tax=Limihaloglobus sulfuriphilus TaxID=1851148 RepID=A0A1Q2MF79_9BACT|nr:HlyD family efflux transporter periplasmic adaptor subunit [Limihaloglobus sulfuriphilus]AQQ71208.1 putative efflux pump membrane fusion protein [Limihaloglobus sulfuriphilus]